MMLKLLLSPLAHYLLIISTFLLTFAIFRHNIISLPNGIEYLMLSILCIFGIFALLYHRILDYRFLTHANIRPPGWRYMVFFIVGASMLEYSTLGIPLLSKNISYMDFHLPFIHHITVSSWMLLFFIQRTNTLQVNLFLVAFALINPLLMQNRDILLLTFYSGLVLIALRKKINLLWFILTIITLIYFFGYLGSIRSPLGMERAMASLPLTISYDPESPFFYFNWFLIYITGSIFNSLYYVGNHAVYYENINAISEFMIHYLNSGFLGFALFELALLSLLIFANKIIKNEPRLLLLYVYLNYEIIMTQFSKKFFLTNTLFTTLFIMIFYIAYRLSNTQTNHTAIPKESDDTCTQ